MNFRRSYFASFIATDAPRQRRIEFGVAPYDTKQTHQFTLIRSFGRQIRWWIPKRMTSVGSPRRWRGFLVVCSVQQWRGSSRFWSPRSPSWPSSRHQFSPCLTLRRRSRPHLPVSKEETVGNDIAWLKLYFSSLTLCFSPNYNPGSWWRPTGQVI